MTTNQTEALIFDLGKVLVPFDFQRGYDRLHAACGLPVAQIRQRIADSGLVPKLEAGQIASQDFVGKLGEALGVIFDYDHFCEMWSSIFLPGTLIPEPLIAELKRRYPLVLLSNTNEMHFAMLERTYPIIGHFERRVLSHQVGAMKPSPVIYQKAVELAGCPPERCFFTDDVADYVEAARRVGIDAVQFHSAGQLQEELARRNIVWDRRS